MLGVLPVCFLVLCGHLLLKTLPHTGIHVPTRSLLSEILDGMAQKMLLEEVQGLAMLLGDVLADI